MSQEKKEAGTAEVKVVARNRRCHQRFAILEALEAGISLHGHEVKSLRQGKVSLEEGFVRAQDQELFLENIHIPRWSHLTSFEYDPVRRRKLLLHRKEILHLQSESQAKRLSLIPLEIYFKRGIAKVSVGLAKGKKTSDRREEIKKREVDRDIQRGLGSR